MKGRDRARRLSCWSWRGRSCLKTEEKRERRLRWPSTLPPSSPISTKSGRWMDKDCASATLLDRSSFVNFFSSSSLLLFWWLMKLFLRNSSYAELLFSVRPFSSNERGLISTLNNCKAFDANVQSARADLPALFKILNIIWPRFSKQGTLVSSPLDFTNL